MSIYYFQTLINTVMEWFDGGVREAIAAAQAKKTVFVVVVTGKGSSNKLHCELF